MITNNNRPVIGRIAKKSFSANRNRNIVAIIAIILTTILFTTVFTLGFGLIDTVKKENIRKAGGDGQVILSNVTDQVYEDVKDNELIKCIGYTKLAADEILNTALKNSRTEMWYMDEVAIEFAGDNLEAGNWPQKYNEIAADSKTLETLGCEKRVGEEIEIEYKVKDEIKKETFILSGYWDTDAIANVGRILVSKDYLEWNNSELIFTYDKDLYYSGSVSLYIMFHNSSSLENKITRLLNAAGYVWENTAADKNADNFVIARISPAYRSVISLGDPGIIGALAAALLLISITGYLIIFNIFQISVINDIRFFGQLKTLGTTKKQISKIVKKQIYWLSVIGIPLGLASGYIIGNLLVPVLMASTEYDNNGQTGFIVNPMIFIGAALFSFLTIRISVGRPEKIASSVSALEALKYMDSSENYKKKKEKRTSHGGKLYRMALANLVRNRKRTMLVILSLSLSAVLFNTVFTLSNGFDEEKYVDKFVDKDFVISTADYFNYKFELSDASLSEKFIEYVEGQPEFGGGGRLISSKVTQECFYAGSNALTSANRDENGNPMVHLYGADRYLLESMKIIEGSLDMEKLNAGKGIIIGETDDGTGKPENNIPIDIGDSLVFHYKGADGSRAAYELEIVAKVLVKENTYTTRQTGETNFYLPSEVYSSMVSLPTVVSYPFDCEPGEGNITSMQEKLAQYIDRNEGMGFDSKQTYIEAFEGIKNTFVIIGNAMGMIIAIIGIVNFLNAMITSIITRKREFAMMQSVGMTNKQLRSMLCMEGLGYSIITVFVSLLLSIIFSFTVVSIISGNIWFFTFHFTLLPIMIISPLFLFISCAVPWVLCEKVAKESMIERLKTE